MEVILEGEDHSLEAARERAKVQALSVMVLERVFRMQEFREVEEKG